MEERWATGDVLTLLGIPFQTRKEEITIACPFCGSKRFAMNLKKSVGHCWKCGEKANDAQYYAACQGISLQEAYKSIKERLNIPASERSIQRPQRIVYERPQEEIAPVKVRDFTYRTLL